MAATHRKVPPKVLAWLIYSADELSAAEAAAVGLVSKVLPAESFAAAAEAYLADIAARPRLILQTIKHFQQRAAASPAMASDYAGALMALVRNAV
jgi:enoyl-CoA hydratase/carnithine racemase